MKDPDGRISTFLPAAVQGGTRCAAIYERVATTRQFRLQRVPGKVFSPSILGKSTFGLFLDRVRILYTGYTLVDYIVFLSSHEDSANPPKTALLDDNSAPSLYPSTYNKMIQSEIRYYKFWEGLGGRTLSQSSFCLVSGRARLSPLNDFSPISWYTSPSDS